jgi:hypothetical protein
MKAVRSGAERYPNRRLQLLTGRRFLFGTDFRAEGLDPFLAEVLSELAVVHAQAILAKLAGNRKLQANPESSQLQITAANHWPENATREASVAAA